ncbi:MAG: LacI family DNA-binding transcriptional regulator [Pseudoxanthomonas sp.]
MVEIAFSAKPNFARIAEVAGVSPSTVDRVLNNRGSVSAKAHRKVVSAARELGTRRMLPALVRGAYRFDIVYTQTDAGHAARLERALKQAASTLEKPVSLLSTVWKGDNETKLADYIVKPRHRRDGLIVVANDNARIKDAVQRAIAEGMPTVLMASDLPELNGGAFVGIDNRAAGRLAGQMVGAMSGGQGRVVVLSPSMAYQDHRERAEGFIEVARREFPALEIDGPIELHDDPARARQAVSRQFVAGQAPRAIYNTGGSSDAIAGVVASTGRQLRPLWLGHEACDDHLGLLEEGLMSLVIDQDLDHQATNALQYLLHQLQDAQAPRTLQTMFHVVTRANAHLYRRGADAGLVAA